MAGTCREISAARACLTKRTKRWALDSKLFRGHGRRELKSPVSQNPHPHRFTLRHVGGSEKRNRGGLVAATAWGNIPLSSLPAPLKICRLAVAGCFTRGHHICRKPFPPERARWPRFWDLSPAVRRDLPGKARCGRAADSDTGANLNSPDQTVIFRGRRRVKRAGEIASKLGGSARSCFNV